MEGVVSFAQRQAWAEQEFAQAALGDRRRTLRLVKAAAQMASNSSGSIPQQAGNRADMKAIYRLFAEPDVTHQAVCAPHFAATRAAASVRPLVFLIQDTTQLNLTSHAACQGLGPMGRGPLRGLHQQNVLAVTPDNRQPLGLLYQAHHRRASRGAQHDRTAQRKVPLRRRESYWWIEAIHAIGAVPSGSRWVHVGDRGEDLFGVYQACVAQGADWLVRAAANRNVQTPAGQARLFEYARQLPAQADKRLTVAGHGKRPPRAAQLQVAAARLRILPPKSEAVYRQHGPIDAWVVRVWEPDPPARTKALEWILLTSLECAAPAGMLFAAEGYALRWIIEELHKSEKTGCQVEARRLSAADRLEPLIGVLSILAVWLLRLKYAARAAPEQPADEQFDAETVAVMGRYLQRPAATLTVGQFWAGIGRLGGHMGRKCDGPIGWLRAWRGWQSFQLILLGASLYAHAEEGKCG